MAFLDKTLLFIHLLAIKGLFIYINPTLITSVLPLISLWRTSYFLVPITVLGAAMLSLNLRDVFLCVLLHNTNCLRSHTSLLSFFSLFNVSLFYFCSLPGHGEQAEQSLWPGTAVPHAEEALRELRSGHGQPGDHQHRAQPQPVLPQGRRSLQPAALIHQS